MAKSNMLIAQTAKNDEFYTQYSDIQTELNHYENHFMGGKTILCNCDDPFESNFCKFFLRNFNYFGLKRLICTSFVSSPIIGTQMTIYDYLDEPVKRGHGYVMDITEVPMANGRGVSDDDIEKLLKSKKRGVKKLEGDGDFRSDECIEYLKQADIVVTNPPFSLFREYISQLIEYNKKFLILSNQNAITYKEFFPYLMNNEVWIGYGFNKSMVYKTPYPNKLEANRKFVISKGYDPDDGYLKVPGICWFTNLDIKKRHEELDLFRKYNDEDYPKYDNYDAINVNKVTEIPCDYYEVMGVPITFMDKYNPDQFEILGITDRLAQYGFRTKLYNENDAKNYNDLNRGPVLKNGSEYKVVYTRIFIRRRG